MSPASRLLLATALAAPVWFGPAGGAVWAQAADDASPHSDAALIAPVTTIQPAQPFEVALRLTTDPGWHVYWTNPGDAGSPPTLTWNVPAGFAPEAMRFPFPERIELPPLASYGYEDEVVIRRDRCVEELVFDLADLLTPADEMPAANETHRIERRRAEERAEKTRGGLVASMPRVEIGADHQRSVRQH